MREDAAHADFMTGFVPGLLDPQLPTPAHVAGHSGKAAVTRYNVYRNNVTVSLVNALRRVYPLTSTALGEEVFRLAALSYVRTAPPASPLLFEYGRQFEAHLRDGGHVAGAQWIEDLARLERLWLDAYHAADANPLTAEALAALPPDRLAEAVFAAHPAACALETPHAIFARWSALRAGDAIDAAPEVFGGETLVVTRPALSVDVRRYPVSFAAFFGRLLAGANLGEAAAAAAELPAGDFDIGHAMAAVLETGAFSGVAIPAVR